MVGEWEDNRSVVVKKIRMYAAPGFSSSEGWSTDLVKIDHLENTIEFFHLGGNPPSVEAFLSFLSKDKDVQMEFALARMEARKKGRKYKYHSKVGSSGCVDVAVSVIDDAPVWAADFISGKKIASMHVSMYDKLNEEIGSYSSESLFHIFNAICCVYGPRAMSRNADWTYLPTKNNGTLVDAAGNPLCPELERFQCDWYRHYCNGDTYWYD